MAEWEASQSRNTYGGCIGLTTFFVVPVVAVITLFVGGWKRSLLVLGVSLALIAVASIVLVVKSLKAADAREKRLATLPPGQEEREQHEIEEYEQAKRNAQEATGHQSRVGSQEVRPTDHSIGQAVTFVGGGVLIVLVLLFATSCQSDFDKCVDEWRDIGFSREMANVRCMDEDGAP